LEEVDDAEVQRVFDTNVFGLLRCVRAVLPSMRKQVRFVINIGSVPAVLPQAVRVSTRLQISLEALSESLAQEMKPYGVASRW